MGVPFLLRLSILDCGLGRADFDLEQVEIVAKCGTNQCIQDNKMHYDFSNFQKIRFRKLV